MHDACHKAYAQCDFMPFFETSFIIGVLSDKKLNSHVKKVFLITASMTTINFVQSVKERGQSIFWIRKTRHQKSMNEK